MLAAIDFNAERDLITKSGIMPVQVVLE